MADEFQSSGNWWDSSSSRNRFETGTPSSSSALNSLGMSFGWSTDMSDNLKSSRSTMESVSVSATSSLVNLQISDCAPTDDPNLHMMGLGLSSQTMDWPNQALYSRGDQKTTESSFRSMLQENMNSNTNFEQETSGQLQWRDKLFSGDSSTNVRGFSLDQTQFSPQYSSGDSTVTSQGLQSNNSNFQMDSPANLYGTSPSTSILQGLFATTHDHLNSQQSSSTSSMNFLPYPQNYCLNNANNEIVPSNWSNKVPQFLRSSSPPKHQHPSNYNHLHFSNNAPFWNASSDSSIKDVIRPAFFPNSHLQSQFAAQPFDEKPKKQNIISQVRESGSVVKKSGNESASKRPRNESSPSPLPAFKVRKEKMGDRITALQQLVSPFGKTDTASVLSEAIEYIKFLHEQVSVLSTPYMKSGAAMQHQQINSEKSKDPEGPKQDLRSRGLCLVPVSSTFPVTHETTVDFWTPTFGGTFR